ncbi:pheromone processing endoprotease [Entomophthora muscae]|uniref:Pheromone processing endoprotease n=1 Tax=Entomophthora muscae TaxID=34485 RepID=A0ACC2S8S7_9FUNG|nr:pheromone processing endoprotease [Entomophthora muscae]
MVLVFRWLLSMTGLTIDTQIFKKSKLGSKNFINLSMYGFPKSSKDEHGTQCAGLVAASRNGRCGVGVAYGAKVSSLLVVGKGYSEKLEADALNYMYDINHIYSMSYGSDDHPRLISQLDKLVRSAFKNGARNGRSGRGSIFVVAAGNGRAEHDNCAFDESCNSIYTIAVGAIDRHDTAAEYSEACTSVLVSAYSGSTAFDGLSTVSRFGSLCDGNLSGTSASAPLVSGVLALVLQVRPDLSWRDIQHLIVESAVPISLDDESWQMTYSGRMYSPQFGYGKINAGIIVENAKEHVKVGDHVLFETYDLAINAVIPDNGGINASYVVEEQDVNQLGLFKIEHVQVIVSLKHMLRGDVAVDLISPNDVVSRLIAPRKGDDSSKGLNEAVLMSVAHWDEPPTGKWTLRVSDIYNRKHGKLLFWKLKLYGAREQRHSLDHLL